MNTRNGENHVVISDEERIGPTEFTHRKDQVEETVKSPFFNLQFFTDQQQQQNDEQERTRKRPRT